MDGVVDRRRAGFGRIGVPMGRDRDNRLGPAKLLAQAAQEIARRNIIGSRPSNGSTPLRLLGLVKPQEKSVLKLFPSSVKVPDPLATRPANWGWYGHKLVTPVPNASIELRNQTTPLVEARFAPCEGKPR